MYLDKVSEISVQPNGNNSVATCIIGERREAYSLWKDWLPSEISHHGKICCEIAREWITATDFSELNGEAVFTGPRWLRQRFIWGASFFPIYWCVAVQKSTLDCGALAALAREIFTVRGVKNYSAQLVQRFSEVATDQWTKSWNTECGTLRWVDRDLIYHEACAIETEDSKIKIWDASAGWWIDPKQGNGYGSLRALRLSGLNLPPDKTLRWGHHLIKSNQWTEIN